MDNTTEDVSPADYDPETETYRCPSGTTGQTIKQMSFACSAAVAFINLTECPDDDACDTDEECADLGDQWVEMIIHSGNPDTNPPTPGSCSLTRARYCKCCCVSTENPPE